MSAIRKLFAAIAFATASVCSPTWGASYVGSNSFGRSGG